MDLDMTLAMIDLDHVMISIYVKYWEILLAD
jgi:hypothetical protein